MNCLESRPVPIGVIVNRVKGKRYEISLDEISQFTELPIVGVIPEDERILEGANKKTLVTASKRNSKSKRAFFEIAARIAGTTYIKFSAIKFIAKILRGD
jgi:septum formation inhibitor-activating ATPase MinD